MTDADHEIIAEGGQMDEATQKVVDGTAWREFCGLLADAGEVILAEGNPADPLDRAEGYRMLTRLLRGALESKLEYGRATEPELITRLRDGLVGIERSFVGVMERNGMKQEDPTGDAFDPERHQAMAEEEDVAHPPGTVLRTWTPAWTLNGRLIRPAMVVVARAPQSTQAPTQASTQAPRPQASHQGASP